MGKFKGEIGSKQFILGKWWGALREPLIETHIPRYPDPTSRDRARY